MYQLLDVRVLPWLLHFDILIDSLDHSFNIDIECFFPTNFLQIWLWTKCLASFKFKGNIGNKKLRTWYITSIDQ